MDEKNINLTAAPPEEQDSALSLEEILREFSSAPEEGSSPAFQEDEGIDVPPAEEAFDGAQTLRFEPLSAKPSAEGDTIPLDTPAIVSAAAAAAVSDETVRFTPVGQEPIAVEPPVPEGAEPFGSNWEPEYEAPMGEYIAPEPIVFRPKSRLHELKRKLVAGPERRYYILSEEGLGKYQIAMFLGMLVVVLSFVSIGLHQFGLVQPNRMRLLVFGELFAMVLAALLGSGRLIDGFASLFKGRFTPDTLLAFSFLVCLGDGIFCLQQVRVPFCAAFSLMMTMSIWGEYERRNTEMGQMDTLRKAVRLNRVSKSPDCYEGRPGFSVSDGEPEDFMDTYQLPGAPEKLMHTFCLIAFLFSAAIGLVAWFVHGALDMSLHTWSAAILASFPATGFICQTRPMAVLERRFHKLGIVLCGHEGIKAMSGAAAVPLSDEDLFPAGSVKINGVKFYSTREPDQTLAFATAVLEASSCNLAPLFTQLLKSRNGAHYSVSYFHTYAAGGYGGEVCGESVLVGTSAFLQEMGVEMPEGARVSQAVYAAVDGELCGVFALSFGKLKSIGGALSALCGYRGLTPVLSSNNFLLDEGFLRSKFSMNTRRVAFPDVETREAVAAWTPDPATSVTCALTTQEGIVPVAYAIAGARSLRTSINLGTAVQIIGSILGLAMVLVLTLVGGVDLLTPGNLLLLHLVWFIPGLLITEWTRHL